MKAVTDVNDSKSDLVTVTLSEDFFNPDGSPFNTGIPPAAVFHVWTPMVNDTVLVDSILAGIPVFKEKSFATATFLMSNGENLNGNHLVNLVHINSTLADAPHNTPNANNQKVRVGVTGKTGQIIVGPVPVIPNLPYYLSHKNEPLTSMDQRVLYNIVKTQGGTMISLDVKGFTDATASMMIFDAVGNLVYTNKSLGNVIPPDKQQLLANDIEKITLNFYWHGITDRGMRAAPGVYQVNVYIKVVNGKLKELLKYSETIAVGR
jgi:hypothetical protein